MTVQEIEKVCRDFRLMIKIVDELPKRGEIGVIYYVRDSAGEGYHQVAWSKKIHMKLRDWLLWRRYEWVCLGFAER